MNPFEKDWSRPLPPPTPGAYADITIVFDRSASMGGMKEAVVEGFNSYVNGLRNGGGGNFWSLVQFDDPSSACGAGEEFPQVLFEKKPEAEIPLLRMLKSSPHFTGGSVASGPWIGGMGSLSDSEHVSGYVTYQPRGCTALVDALCDTIDRTALRTSGMEHVKVVMGIFTDGEENSSHRHTSPQLRERIAKYQKERGWDFLYFGANQDSFAEAGKCGIGGVVASGHLPTGTSYTNNFQATPDGMRSAIGSGLFGMAHIASGSVCSGSLHTEASSVQPSVVVGGSK